MKKLFTLLSICFLYYAHAQAPCEPDLTITTPGIYPDSASGFPPAVATYEYNLIITAVIPADTMFFPGVTLNVDSIGVTEIEGLPEGFTATPSRPSGFWPGGTSGCMLISGTPAHDQVGDHPLVFTVAGYLQGITVPITYEVTFYSIKVLDSLAFWIRTPHHTGQINLNASPNPFMDVVNIDFYSSDPGVLECIIFNAQGQEAFSKSFTAIRGENSFVIDGSNLKPGLYYLVLRRDTKQILSTKKLIKY